MSTLKILQDWYYEQVVRYNNEPNEDNKVIVSIAANILNEHQEFLLNRRIK